MQVPALRLPRLFGRSGKGAGRLHCELDDWWFDARYTDGACPICGWRPEGSAFPAPLWLRLHRRLDWELLGLVAMLAVLGIVGYEVELAAGVSWHDLISLLTGR